jgi:hypothetical protein
MPEYQDRFDPSRYARDEAVSLSIDGAPDFKAFTMPERLFSRVQQIAGAYELHLLPVIDYYGEVRLSREQIRTLRDELVFIRSVVADPLLDSYLQDAQSLIETSLRAPTGVQLVVQGP